MRQALALGLRAALALLLVGCVGGAHSAPGNAAPPSRSLENTYWRLMEVRGRPAVAADSTREAHLRFVADSGGGSRVAGSTGCNRLSGSYTRDGAALRFGPAATTRMACVEPAISAQETDLLAALAATTRHAIVGDVLTLSDAGGPLARFTAAAVR
jgi:heat shock protein HslJ